MDFELTSEQKRVQSLARQFAEQEVAPIAREADEKGEFPLHLVKRMGELGFLAGPLEPDYGGAGMDYVSYALLCEELGRVDSSVLLALLLVEKTDAPVVECSFVLV